MDFVIHLRLIWVLKILRKAHKSTGLPWFTVSPKTCIYHHLSAALMVQSFSHENGHLRTPSFSEPTIRGDAGVQDAEGKDLRHFILEVLCQQMPLQAWCAWLLTEVCCSLVAFCRVHQWIGTSTEYWCSMTEYCGKSVNHAPGIPLTMGWCKTATKWLDMLDTGPAYYCVYHSIVVWGLTWSGWATLQGIAALFSECEEAWRRDLEELGDGKPDGNPWKPQVDGNIDSLKRWENNRKQ